MIVFRYSDPLKTSQGMLSLKVFRLSDKMMTMYKDAEFSAERWEIFIQDGFGKCTSAIMYLLKSKLTSKFFARYKVVFKSAETWWMLKQHKQIKSTVMFLKKITTP